MTPRAEDSDFRREEGCRAVRRGTGSPRSTALVSERLHSIRCGHRAGGFSTVRGVRGVAHMAPRAEDSDFIREEGCRAVRQGTGSPRPAALVSERMHNIRCGPRAGGFSTIEVDTVQVVYVFNLLSMSFP